MANAFMPSAFASMAAAGQDTLEQLMKQRLFEQQLQQSQLGMQRQVNADLEQSRRFDAQERYQQGVLAARAREDQIRLQIAQEKLRQEQAEAAAKARGARNVAGAADMYFTGLTRGEDANSPAMLRVASEGNLSAFERAPKPPETREERDARIKGDRIAAAQGDADAIKMGLKPTKVAKGEKPEKDKPGLPSGFKQALRNRIGTTGFTDRDTAFESLKSNWAKWRMNYPDLDASMVNSELDNLFGPRDPKVAIPADLMASVAAKMRLQQAGAAKK